MIKTLILITLVTSILGFGACNSGVQQEDEHKQAFLEVRIRRWTALEGGEIFVLRKINHEWSAMLLGDGVRFSCAYQKTVQPKSGWDVLWASLQESGLMEIPDGNYTTNCCTDGNGFDAEVFYLGRLKRFSFFLPEKIDTKEAKQIQNIGDVVSREFDTPMFLADYSRNDVGEYLIDNCREMRESSKK